jgi:hypothetical protein
VEIWVDGTNVTPTVGDPNAKGSPAWDATGNAWGADGLHEWATGPLDLTNATTWGLGEHKVELAETGGSGGNLKLYTYVIYPFTAAKKPDHDTCAAPKVLDVMGGSVTISDTTEDSMGKVKATDDYAQAACGGSGGGDVVYKITLTDWRRLTFDVTAPFTTRMYLRKGDCAAGQLVACGTKTLTTDALKTGDYYLFVDSDGNLLKGDYTLKVQSFLPDAPANDTCTGPTTLTFDETGKAEVYGVSLFANHNYTGSCGGAAGLDMVYQFDIPAGTSQFDIAVTADFNPVLYLAKDVCTSSIINCAPMAKYSMAYPATGTYFLFLDGKTAADKGEFTLSVQLVQ